MNKRNQLRPERIGRTDAFIRGAAKKHGLTYTPELFDWINPAGRGLYTGHLLKRATKLRIEQLIIEFKEQNHNENHASI